MAMKSFEILLWVAAITLFLESSRGQETLECKKGWLKHDGNCYVFDNPTRQYDEARKACKSYFSSLAVIEDHTEWNWVAKHLGTRDDEPLAGWWIEENEGFALPFANEPDSVNGKEKCVVLNQQGYSRDEDCFRWTSAICKSQKSKTETCPGSGTSQFIAADSNSCFFRTKIVTTWSITRKECQFRNGDLLSINNAAELKTVKEGLQNHQVTDWWTGLSYPNATVGYVFTDNTPYSEDVMPWLTKDVLKGLTEGLCPALLNYGKLTKNKCESSGRAICKYQLKKRRPTRCPVNWENKGNSCYYFSAPYTANWTKAESTCKSMGAHLLKTDNAYEKNWLKIINAFDADKFQWTGLNDRSVKDVFVWDDGTRYNKNLVNLRQSRQSDANCVAIDDGTDYVRWDCISALPFICEKKVDMNRLVRENLGK